MTGHPCQVESVVSGVKPHGWQIRNTQNVYIPEWATVGIMKDITSNHHMFCYTHVNACYEYHLFKRQSSTIVMI